MAYDKFIIKNGAVIESILTGSTVLDIQGKNGQLFSITDNLVGDVFAVSDITGIPILKVNSNGKVTIDGSTDISESVNIGTDLNITGALYVNGFRTSGKNTGDQPLGNLATYDYVDKTFLPLTGGTLTGPLTMYTIGTGNYNQGIRINRTATSQWALLTIGFTGNTTEGTSVNTWTIGTPASSNNLIFNNNGSSEANGLCLQATHPNNGMKWNNNTVWHAGNDGSGSGLEADLLDGLHKDNLTYFNGVSTRFSGDLNTLGLSTTSGIYNLSTVTNSYYANPYGTLFAFCNADISTQFHIPYNGEFITWRKSIGTTYAGSTWRRIWDSANSNLSTIDWNTNGLKSYNTTHLCITSGNTLIGTTTDSSSGKLQVIGNINASGQVGFGSISGKCQMVYNSTENSIDFIIN